MKITQFYADFFKFVCCVLLLGIGFSNAKAQCDKEISIQSIARPNPTTIWVTLNTPQGLTPSQEQIIQDGKNWRVYNPEIIKALATSQNEENREKILAEMIFPVAKARIDFTAVNELKIPRSKIEEIQVILTLNTSLSNNLNYLMKIDNLISPNCFQGTFEAKSVNNGGSKKLPKKPLLGKAKGRGDADIYVQGLAEGAKKEKTYFTVDALAKKRFRFAYNNYVEPFFELKTSTSKKADPDSANIGINIVRTIGVNKKFLNLSKFDFTNGVKLESDTDFKNVNLVYQTRADFNFIKLNYGNGRQTINVIPFIGLELGRNYKSPVAETKNKSIVRPLFGANLYFLIFQNESNDKAVSFETQYIRRLLLKPEVTFDVDKDSNFVALPINGKPRDYIKSSLNFDFARNFGFSANYEYGQLPPTFKLVNSKFSFGLTFKGKFDQK